MPTTEALGIDPKASLGGPAVAGGTPVPIGVLWDYPFSLVRQLLVAFVAILAFAVAGVWALAQPVGALEALVNVIPVALATLLSMYVAEVIGVTVRPMPRLRVEAIFAAIAIACSCLGLGYLFLTSFAPPAALVCATPALAVLAVFLQRRWNELRGGQQPVAAALFAGTRGDAERSLRALAGLPGLSVSVVFLPPGVEDRSPFDGVPVARPARELEKTRADGVDLFVVGRAPPEDLAEILVPCARAGFLVESLGDLLSRAHGCIDLRRGADLPLLSRLTAHARPSATQRAADFVIAAALLLATLPLWPILAAAIRLTSRGPVFYRQTRVGLWGRNFEILKFRTMREDAEAVTGPVWASSDDPRVTRVGRVLRASRLDELPQLWNVLRGQMSLVGPRPERPAFVRRLAAAIPLYDARHSVRPGITGWAQVRYRYGSSEEDARRKLGYDLFFILNRSLTFYAAVLLETAKVVIFRRGGR